MDIVTTILNNDVEGLRLILAEKPLSIEYRFDRDILFEEKFVHWIYTGDTLLHLAAAGHMTAIVKCLLSTGADPNSAANRRRSTPLHYAADGIVNDDGWDPVNQVETIRTLVAAGARVDAADQNGATPLHRAVRTRCAAAAKFLIAAGVNPAFRNKSGATPFHLAVQNTGRGGSGSDKAKLAQQEIIELFLELDKDLIDLTDHNKKSVNDIAAAGWVKELLEQRRR